MTAYGGGVITISAHTMTVNGTVSADGGSAGLSSGAGASGGSILIHTTVFNGNGLISAKGTF